jgi:GR25 family glycosyltransferase involved in LPS biosynthesis
MKYYIIHYTKNTERRAFLEKQLEDFGITDVEWIKEYDREDPLIPALHAATKSPMSVKDFSGFSKHMLAMQRMVDNDIKEAVILEDDVVFYPEFREATFHHKTGFLRLGPGVAILEQNKPPRGLKVFLTSNPGGAEAQWVSLDFAKAAVQNISFEYTIDIYHQALLYHINGEQIRFMNLCYQTSLVQSTTEEIAKSLDWEKYHHFRENFTSYKRYTFSELYGRHKNGRDGVDARHGDGVGGDVQ